MLDPRTRIIAIVGGVLLLIGVLELVRRRRLMERYALLWIASIVLVVVAVSWNGALEGLANVMGLKLPVNAVFVVAVAFVVLLLIHFSLVVTRLSDETKVLAQHVARLDNEVNRLKDGKGPEGTDDDAGEGSDASGSRRRTPVA